MERNDTKNISHREWEANYNAIGRETNDLSTTILSGTRREVDLIVAGLITLRAQQEMARAAEELSRPDRFGYPNLPSGDEVAELIKSIENPNYATEPKAHGEY